MRIKSNLLLLTLFLFLSLFLRMELYSQCGCMSSISVGTLSPNLGASSTGTMRQGYLSLNLATNYSEGDYYWSGWNKVPAQTVKDFRNISSVLIASYGITNRLSADLEFAYTLRNYINAPPFKYESSGLNFLNILAKYNIYYNPRYDFEVTAGAGLKAPLQMVSDTNYKYTQSSQGAFGGIYQFFLHKGFKESKLHLFLIHRGEIFSRNNADYQYGPFFVTTLVTSRPISKKFLGLIELKNEYKTQDENPEEINFDSGFMNFVVSPQLIYANESFNIGLKFDYPVIRYYNGSQAAKKYSISLNFGINTKLF